MPTGDSISRGTTTGALVLRAFRLANWSLAFRAVTDFGEALAAGRGNSLACGVATVFLLALDADLVLSARSLYLESSSSAFATTSFASVTSRFASLTCFLVRRAACLASLRRRRATLATSLAVANWPTAFANRMRAR